MTLKHLLLATVVLLPLAMQTKTEAAANDASIQAASELARTAEGAVEIKRDTKSGSVRFISAQPGGDLLPAKNIADKSAAFLSSNAALFGLSDANRELKLLETGVDQTGQRTDKYKQLYQGVPVFGARLVTAIDRTGKLKSVNGAVAPDLNINVVPTVAAAAAARNAMQHLIQASAPRDLGALKSRANTLYVYGQDFVRGQNGRYQLVWEVEVIGQNLREFIYVSAHHGKVVDQITGTYDALDRNIYEGGFNTGNLVWSEGDATPTGTTAWDELIAYSEDTYNLFSSVTGGTFLSWNGNDATMNAVNNDPAISCPNAQFTGSYIRFCNGTTTDDVVAHEWAHGYTQETHGLIYLYQSGAMNEAYSDIFGEVVDFLNGAGTDAPDNLRSETGCSVFGGSAPPSLTVNAPANVAGSYAIAGANFNPSGSLTITDNLATASPNEACGAINGNVAGNIAIVDRGNCPFVDKVSNAQAAGATGVIVVNNIGGPATSMGGSGAVNIPAVMVTMADGNALKAAVNANATITLSASTQNSLRWLVGEDSSAFGGAIRDMWNPTCFGDPDKVTSPLYACDPDLGDAGGVHSNSAIINKGFALLVDGGNANGESIASIGLTKATHIYWRTMNVYQTPVSGYADHASALSASCADLIGVGLPALSTNQTITSVGGEVISAFDCAQVDKLVPALELDQQPEQCNFQTLLAQSPPAPCAINETQISVLEQDFESGLGGWTAGSRALVNPATFDVPQWAVTAGLPFGVAGQAAFAADPIFGNCTTDIEAGVNYLESPAFIVPDNALVSFDHSLATEADYDGGNIKISVNGGAFQLVPSSAFIYNAYTGALTASDNPLGGEAAWHGSDGGSFQSAWGESQIDLSSFASSGDLVELRFEMGTDGCNGVKGWYVDNVKAYSCEILDETDGDGVPDSIDNCTLVPNADQRDTNGDGYGNACDPDINNDGTVNFGDVSLWIPFFNTATTGDADFNGDGQANFGDYALFPQYFLQPPGPGAIDNL